MDFNSSQNTSFSFSNEENTEENQTKEGQTTENPLKNSFGEKSEEIFSDEEDEHKVLNDLSHFKQEESPFIFGDPKNVEFQPVTPSFLKFGGLNTFIQPNKDEEPFTNEEVETTSKSTSYLFEDEDENPIFAQFEEEVKEKREDKEKNDGLNPFVDSNFHFKEFSIVTEKYSSKEEEFQVLKRKIQNFEYDSPFKMNEILKELEIYLFDWRKNEFENKEIEKEVLENMNNEFKWKDIDMNVLVDYLYLQNELDGFIIKLPRENKKLKLLSYQEIERISIKEILSKPLCGNIENEINQIIGPLIEKQKIIEAKKDWKWEYLPSIQKYREFMNLSFSEICKMAWENKKLKD